MHCSPTWRLAPRCDAASSEPLKSYHRGLLQARGDSQGDPRFAVSRSLLGSKLPRAENQFAAERQQPQKSATPGSPENPMPEGRQVNLCRNTEPRCSRRLASLVPVVADATLAHSSRTWTNCLT